jgi:hypothetical protein
MQLNNQPWLGSPVKECFFILSPALVPVLLVYVFNDYFVTHEVTTFWWVVLVLCIDVSHVYSTLFRLYWDKKTFTRYKHTLVLIPILAFGIGWCLHYYNSLFFWRILAYIAVFHFVRQQYGFLRLYARKESPSRTNRFIDTLAIYNATLYPLLYWHLHATDKLAWFVPGDFIYLGLHGYEDVITVLYFTIMATYLLKEGITSFSEKTLNIPKNLIVVGTYASWYVGIVAFQADLIFTLLNVVAHGVPYMALIWIHGEKKTKSSFNFNFKGASIFVVTLLILAYLEENFWDGMIWKDHPEIFPVFSNQGALQDPVFLSLAVSLLVLPQVTHYVLDGFIWRFSKDMQARLE